MRFFVALLLTILLPTQTTWAVVQGLPHTDASVSDLWVHEHWDPVVGDAAPGDSDGHDVGAMDTYSSGDDAGSSTSPHSAHYHPVLSFVGLEPHSCSILVASDRRLASGSSFFRSRVPPPLDRPPADGR
jgi:hypothetical protein